MDMNEFLPAAPEVEPEAVTAKPAKKKPAQGNLLETPEKLDRVDMATAIHFAAKEAIVDTFGHLGLGKPETTDTEENLSRPLYEMVEDYRQLVDYLVSRDGVMDEESMAAWKNIRGTISEKLENCGKMLRELELRKSSTDHEKKRLGDRSTTLKNSHKHLREYIKAQLLEMDELKFEGLTLNCTVYENGHSCDVYDEARVPDEFCTVTVKMTAAEWTKAGPAVMAIIGKDALPVVRDVDTKAVIKDWASGAGVEQVPGTIVEPRMSIRVY